MLTFYFLLVVEKAANDGYLIHFFIRKPAMKSVEQQLEIIRRGVDEILVEKELVARLKEGRPLRIEIYFQNR